MAELTINEKRKIIRREFKQFNQENGFRFVRPNTLLRERNDILQYLQFKIKAGYMSCEIACFPFHNGNARQKYCDMNSFFSEFFDPHICHIFLQNECIPLRDTLIHSYRDTHTAFAANLPLT